jgi:deazaflavin-dependent oxidoreductase (nitroreductase family)
MHPTERKHNPFIASASGGRILSALMLPFFLVRPPVGFGVLTTIGRKTGKERRRCVRAIRVGDEAYLVAIGGRHAAWAKNIEVKPDVKLRVRGGRFAGRARELHDTAERERARWVYCGTINPFDYDECILHRTGRPTRTKIEELHRSWFENGLPLVVELARREQHDHSR